MLLFSRLIRSVERLHRGVAKLTEGDLTHRLLRSTGDEVGDLEMAFNKMASELQNSFDRLQRTADSFARFVPQNFLQVLAPDGLENIQVGIAVRRKLTILFCDIRGYTSLSERVTPAEMFDFLNDYLAHMGAAISGAGGFIDKYIGDAIMALFDEAGADGALAAAQAMQRALVGFNQKRAATGWKPIDIGIGLHTGEVVMGMVGFVSRIDSTVIGDAVNVASRVEGLTKQHHAQILVTDAVVEALTTREAHALRLVDPEARIRGKQTPTALYALEEPVAAPHDSSPTG